MGAIQLFQNVTVRDPLSPSCAFLVFGYIKELSYPQAEVSHLHASFSYFRIAFVVYQLLISLSNFFFPVESLAISVTVGYYNFISRTSIVQNRRPYSQRQVPHTFTFNNKYP